MPAITFPAAVGIDIAKASFDAARLAGGKYQQKKFDNTPGGFACLAEWLAGFGGGPAHLSGLGRLIIRPSSGFHGPHGIAGRATLPQF